jgi:uncharacterized RDD family membrane protein YckC
MPPEEQKLHSDMMQSMAPVSEYEMRVGFGYRLLAAIMDIIIVSVISFAVFWVTGIFEEMMRITGGMSFASPGDMQMFNEFIRTSIAPISLIIGIIYNSMEILFAATPGKMILGMRIAQADRREADMQKLALRAGVKHSDYIFNALSFLALSSLFDTLSTIAFLVILIGFFFTLSYKRQAFHDMAAGTAVYYKEEIIDAEPDQAGSME